MNSICFVLDQICTKIKLRHIRGGYIFAKYQKNWMSQSRELIWLKTCPQASKINIFKKWKNLHPRNKCAKFQPNLIIFDPDCGQTYIQTLSDSSSTEAENIKSGVTFHIVYSVAWFLFVWLLSFLWLTSTWN